MVKILCRIIGTALCFFGVLGMLTPIPFGLIFFVIGLMFLIPTTPSAALMVKKARRRMRLFDQAMSAITNKLPYPYRRILKETEIGLVD